MEDVFKNINCITMVEGRRKDYHHPEYDPVSQVSTERVHEVSMPSRYVKPRTSLTNKTHSSPQYNYQNSSTFRSTHRHHDNQYNRSPGILQYNCMPINMKCYYCKGGHHIKECNMLSRDKTKYKLKSADIIKRC